MISYHMSCFNLELDEPVGYDMLILNLNLYLVSLVKIFVLNRGWVRNQHDMMRKLFTYLF